MEYAVLKLLCCLLSAFLIAGVLLHLRHERMQINYRINLAHRRLQELQTELRNQNIQLGFATAPVAIEKAIGRHKLPLAAGASGATASTD